MQEQCLRLNKKVYVGLDLFKFIGALLILFHHTAPYIRILRDVSNISSSFVVGFFFITSGFFFGKSLLSRKNSQSKKEYFKKYEIRLIKIYLVWTVISLPLNVEIYWNKYGSNPFQFILAMLRNIFLTGSYGIFWFILSLIGAAGLVYLFTKVWKKEKLMYVLATILFVIGFLNTNFHSALSQYGSFSLIFKGIYLVWSSSRNFALTGWFYFAIGYFFAKNKIKIKLPSAVVCFAIFTGIRAIENFAFKISGNEFFLSNTLMAAAVFQSVFFFLIAVNLELKSLKKYSPIMREFSSTLFYTHMIILGILDSTLKKGFCFDFFLTLAISLAFYIIIKLINNKHLNILING